MKRVLLIFTLILFVGVTLSAQSKRDTTIYFKTVIDCAGCKGKLEKNLTFEKGVRSFKVDMEESMVTITYRRDKNSVEGLRKAMDKTSDVKIIGKCNEEGVLLDPKDKVHEKREGDGHRHNHDHK